MQTEAAPDQTPAHDTTVRDHSDVRVVAHPVPATAVGPLGGIVFSALCIVAYVAVVIAAMA